MINEQQEYNKYSKRFDEMQDKVRSDVADVMMRNSNVFNLLIEDNVTVLLIAAVAAQEAAIAAALAIDIGLLYEEDNETKLCAISILSTHFSSHIKAAIEQYEQVAGGVSDNVGSA